MDLSKIDVQLYPDTHAPGSDPDLDSAYLGELDRITRQATIYVDADFITQNSSGTGIGSISMFGMMLIGHEVAHVAQDMADPLFLAKYRAYELLLEEGHPKLANPYELWPTAVEDDIKDYLMWQSACGNPME